MTSQLVELYNKAGDDRNFEVILFGYDSDQAAMEAYMKKSKAAFPALKMAEKSNVELLTQLGNSGFLPGAVLVSPSGEVVSNDPKTVLTKLKDLVEG